MTVLKLRSRIIWDHGSYNNVKRPKMNLCGFLLYLNSSYVETWLRNTFSSIAEERWKQVQLQHVTADIDKIDWSDKLCQAHYSGFVNSWFWLHAFTWGLGTFCTFTHQPWEKRPALIWVIQTWDKVRIQIKHREKENRKYVVGQQSKIKSGMMLLGDITLWKEEIGQITWQTVMMRAGRMKTDIVIQVTYALRPHGSIKWPQHSNSPGDTSVREKMNTYEVEIWASQYPLHNMAPSLI